MTTSNNIASGRSTYSLRHPLAEFKFTNNRDTLGGKWAELFRPLHGDPVSIKSFYARGNIVRKNIRIADLERGAKDIQAVANAPTSFKNMRPEKLQLQGNGGLLSKKVQNVSIKGNWKKSGINPSTHSNIGIDQQRKLALVPSGFPIASDYWSLDKINNLTGGIVQRKATPIVQSGEISAAGYKQGAEEENTNGGYLLPANRKLPDLKNARSVELVIPGIVEKNRRSGVAHAAVWPVLQFEGGNKTQEFTGFLQQKNRELIARTSEHLFANVSGPTEKAMNKTSTVDQKLLSNVHPFHLPKGRLNTGTQPFFSNTPLAQEKELKPLYPIEEIIAPKSRKGQDSSMLVDRAGHKNGSRTKQPPRELHTVNLNLNRPMIENFTIMASSGNESLRDFKQKVEEVLLDILKSANAIN